MFTHIENQFIMELKQRKLDFPPNVIEKLIYFIKLLLEANQHTNLTAITLYEEALYKHLFDSLLIYNIPEFYNSTKILDIGSGAGIPCIPLAISCPNKIFYSIDSTQKKINFQHEVIKKLNITNLYPIWDRAEIIGHHPEHRGQYDNVLARAVAPINILAEITLPFLKINHFALLYKGKEINEELKTGATAITKLGAEVSEVFYFQLPQNMGDRGIVSIKKINDTPSIYPRKPGTPQKKPL